MSFPLPALQAAIVTLLEQDSTLMSLLDAVYDQAPDGAAFPYLGVGNISGQLQQLCEDQAVCTFNVTPETFGMPNYGGCSFDFNTSYRCYNLDRLRYAQGSAEQQVTLDCSELNPDIDPDLAK